MAAALGQFIQEEHAIVGQRHFARHRHVAATDQSCIRDGVMRGATRAGRDQCGAVAGEASDAVNTRSQWPSPRSSPALLHALPWECLSADLPQRRLRLGKPERHVHSAVQLDSGRQLGSGLLCPAGPAVQPAQPLVAVGHERAHAQFFSQGQGLLVVRFGRRHIGGVGVGMDGAKLVQRGRLVAAFLLLPGQVERLACVLPGLLAAPRQRPDLAEPCDPGGKTLQRARADTFVDRLLQQRAPLREAPLEYGGIAQARCDRSQLVPVAGGTTEGQTLIKHPDGMLQVPLGEVQVAEATMGDDRCLPSAC